MGLPHGHQCYFWETSKSGSDSWIEKAKNDEYVN